MLSLCCYGEWHTSFCFYVVGFGGGAEGYWGGQEGMGKDTWKMETALFQLLR